MSRFINTELKLDSESSDLQLDSEKESKFDNELMAKLESGPELNKTFYSQKILLIRFC